MAEDVMVNLTRDAVAARQMGMTYGQYMAYKQRIDTQQRQSAVLKHERLPVCACCGEPIPKGSKSRKYCGAECADKARRAQTAIAKKRKKEYTEPGRCGTCDFRAEHDPRCMCSESQWAGICVEPENYCMHYIHQIEEN